LGGGGWASNPRSPLLEGDIESDIGSDEEEGIVNEPEEALEMNEDLANNPNDYLDNEFDPRTHNLDNRLVEWGKSNMCFIFGYGPMTICLLVSLISSNFDTCSENLRDWAWVQLIIFIGLVFTTCQFQIYLAIARRTGEMDPEWRETLVWVYSFYRITLFATIVWCLYGAISIASGSLYTCKHDMALYRICYVIIIVHTFFFCIFLLSCCSGCLCFCLLCCFFRATQAPPGATQETINEFSREEVFSTELIPDKDRALCPICLEDYEEGDKLRYLQCKHHFHLECVDKWLLSNKSCPVCKRNVDDKDDDIPEWGGERREEGEGEGEGEMERVGGGRTGKEGEEGEGERERE